jgi:hypothetical protein
MSVASVPPRIRRHHESSLPELAEICRARQVVDRLGGRFSLELGIYVDRKAEEIDRWALAATLLGDPGPVSVAIHTYRVLEHAGVRTFEDVRDRDREEVVCLLGEGGYARCDESTASRLLVLAEAVADRYAGGLATLGETIVEPGELERALGALPGWDSRTVGTFLRELRGVWPGADVPLDPCAALAARHVALPTDLHGLSALAAAAHLDFRDLEVGLTRLALVHDSAHCPGGEECPFAEFDREQFVHF